VPPTGGRRLDRPAKIAMYKFQCLVRAILALLREYSAAMLSEYTGVTELLSVAGRRQPAHHL
jgi:hypothetical protein